MFDSYGVSCLMGDKCMSMLIVKFKIAVWILRRPALYSRDSSGWQKCL